MPEPRHQVEQDLQPVMFPQAPVGTAISTSWGQCYKTFYGRNLQAFVMSKSVRPLQAFPALSNDCG